MTTKVQFRFYGRKDVLDIVDTGGALVSYLANEDSICPLIGSKIKLVKELGKGSFGTAFLIEIEGMGPKEYVAKRTKKSVVFTNVHQTYSLKKWAKFISEKFMTDLRTTINLNGGDPKKIIHEGDKIYVPKYSKQCHTSKLKNYPRFDGKGDTVIQPGSYLCKNELYSEYVIGILAGNLYRQHISINFIDVFGFATCPIKKKAALTVSQYIFMDKIDMSLNQIPRKYAGGTMASILLIQIIHAIATYQHHYKISHNDLHDGNVFIEYVTPSTKFNGETLYDADWYHYHISGTDIYIPAIPYIAKIGDFGFSVKWSSPIVGNKMSIKTGINQYDGHGPLCPNWYSKSYDMLHITHFFYKSNPKNSFIRKLYMRIGFEPLLEEKIIRPKIERPQMKPLESLALRGATPKDILTNKELLGDCFNKPPSGKIVTLGTIS